MQRYGIKFYTALAARCDQDIGFCASGVVYIYETVAGWQRAQQVIEVAHAYGTRLEVLTRQRAVALIPQVRFEATAGMLFDPDAIRLRAGEALEALATELASEKVHLRYDTEVEGLLVQQRQITGVRTNKGEIYSSRVLVATGA
jgi:glycine/D-amino acid oxidase-like deaminating enzyme